MPSIWFPINLLADPAGPLDPIVNTAATMSAVPQQLMQMQMQNQAPVFDYGFDANCGGKQQEQYQIGAPVMGAPQGTPVGEQYYPQL